MMSRKFEAVTITGLRLLLIIIIYLWAELTKLSFHRALMHKKQDFINLIIISSAIKTCCELWRTIASCGPPEKKSILNGRHDFETFLLRLRLRWKKPNNQPRFPSSTLPWEWSGSVFLGEIKTSQSFILCVQYEIPQIADAQADG